MSEASTNSNGRQSQTVDRTEASTPLEIPARSHDLLPCPFCGEAMRISVQREMVVCLTCDANGPETPWGCNDYEAPDEAIKLWNTRAGQVADEPSAAGDGE